MEISLGPNMAYVVPDPGRSETAFTDENIYESPDGPEVGNTKIPGQELPKKKIGWFRVTIAVVALLGLAFGIATLVFSIVRSSNQEQLLEEANMSLEVALSRISKLPADIQEIMAELPDSGTPQPSTPPPTTEQTTAESTMEPPTYSPRCPGEGWRPVVQLNMNYINQDCPEGWQLTDNSDTIRTCGRVNTDLAACDSIILLSEGQYSEVCGRATAYRFGDPVAFFGHIQLNQDIDNYYLDGLSVTHGLHALTSGHLLVDCLLESVLMINCHIRVALVTLETLLLPLLHLWGVIISVIVLLENQVQYLCVDSILTMHSGMVWTLSTHVIMSLVSPGL